MKLFLSLNNEQSEALVSLMKSDLQTNKTSYIGYLIAQEVKRRRELENKKTSGRPRKNEADELPDENEPRTLKIPSELKKYALPYRQNELVNQYDIEMLEAKANISH